LVTLSLITKYVTNAYSSHGEKKQLHDLNRGIYPYTYMGGYALIMGVVLFMGFNSMKILVKKYLVHPDLTSVFCSYIVGVFGLSYMAYIQSIIEEIYRIKIVATPWDNVIGYGIGRALIVLVFFFIYERM
jgi:hypothetical protein